MIIGEKWKFPHKDSWMTQREKFFTLLLWQKICELCSQFAASESWWNTNCFFWVYPVHLASPALLIRWRLVGRFFALLLLFLHHGLSCVWLRLCQRAVDGHRLSVGGQIEGTFDSCSDTKKCNAWSWVWSEEEVPVWPFHWCHRCWWAGGRCWILWRGWRKPRHTVLPRLERLRRYRSARCTKSWSERTENIKFMLTNSSRSSPAQTEPPTGRGSPWISPLLLPRLPELHLEGT